MAPHAMDAMPCTLQSHEDEGSGDESMDGSDEDDEGESGSSSQGEDDDDMEGVWPGLLLVFALFNFPSNFVSPCLGAWVPVPA